MGETEKALDLGLRALGQVDEEKDPLTACRVLAAIAMAEDHAGNYHVAENWRHRQIDTCRRAGDRVFLATGKYGVGKMAALQGRHAEALQWANEALADFDELGFVSGAFGAKLVIGGSLIAMNRDLDQAQSMLAATLAHYKGEGTAVTTAEAEELLARLAELRGNTQQALAHQKAAMKAAAEAARADRERRLAYLQIQFDSQAKEQQIALLEAEKQLAESRAMADQRRQLLLLLGLGGLLVTAVLLLVVLLRSVRERYRYRWQSEHDSLTGLYNHQRVRELGEAAFARSRSSGRPLTAVALDIDNFKGVNDRHGHAAGDEALRSLAGWIVEALGASAIAGRSGGDEFTVLLEADAGAARAMVQRLRGLIAPVTAFGRTFSYHISAGLCQAGADTGSLEQLIHQADQALYRAKREGRDRVVCADDVPAEPAAMAATGLVVVGGGIQFARHASARCLSEIRAAEVVFCLADPFSLGMIAEHRPDVVNLGAHYASGKDRRETYREIDAAIMREVRAGKRVCAVFHGHPGVFADVPHRVIRKARAEGFGARMEPGISAEACLYADLGLDPGQRGVQSMEATHFLVHDRRIDPAGLVLLWQVALCGDLSCTRFEADPAGLETLLAKLLRWYPPDHEVILYEAAQLPIDAPRADRLALRDLPTARYREYTMLVIPPLGELEADPAYLPACELRTG